MKFYIKYTYLRIFILFALLIIFNPQNLFSQEFVLSVGNNKFTKDELKTVEKILQFYYPESGSTKVGAYSKIIEGYLLAETLKNMGYEITKDMLEKESIRRDKSSLMPDELKKLKKIFGDDSKVYNKLWVLPTYANSRFFFGVFPNDVKIHKNKKDEALKLLEELLQKKFDTTLFEETVKIHKEWKRNTSLFSEEEGFVSYGNKEDKNNLINVPDNEIEKILTEKSKTESKAKANKYEKEIFSKLKQNEIFPQVVENQEYFSVIRWIGFIKLKNLTYREVELLILPKKSAHEYFMENARQIPINIEDAEIKKELVKKFSWISLKSKK
ncbi:hypothetical protein HZA55_03560 [Candidatus Poribacteria bacterium]|nr:hypothetical protein [Candidatus Poribacteria bacterium]